MAAPKALSGARDVAQRSRSVEETCLVSAMICLEGHFTRHPPTGPLTMEYVTAFVSRTLDKTHSAKEVR